MAPLRWGKQVERTLIDLVREHQPLWNPSHPNYSKKSLKRVLYGQIADIMRAVFPEIHDITPGNLIYV